jgi:hypothetical protein
MIEDELVKLWQSSPNQERIKFERSRLMIDVQSGIDRFNKLIRYRDMREGAGALIGIPMFIFFAYKAPFLVSKIGAVLVVLWGIYVVFRLRSVAKHKPGPLAGTYLDYLYTFRKYLQSQKHLLDTVLYWYILPCFTGITLIFLGPSLESGELGTFAKLEAAVVGVSVAIYFLNKYAVKESIVPRLEKVEGLIKVMEKP